MFVPGPVRLLIALPVAAWLVASVNRVEATVIFQQAKLTALDGAMLDEFGSSVAIDGDTAIVGAPFDDDLGDGSGSAYIFQRTGATWAQQAKLTASDGARLRRFGHSVAISGDTVVVGSMYGAAAYVYHRTGGVWTQEDKLVAPAFPAEYSFGRSVSIDDDMVIVGAPDHVPAANQSGTASIFQRSGAGNWTHQKELISPDPVPSLRFGTSVAISAGTAMVGADPFSEATGADGAAYVFQGSGSSWSRRAKLTPADGGYPDGFGKTVAISGVNAIGGAVGLGALHDSGAAYIFHQSGSWGQQAKLMVSDGEVLDFFGQSVAISGEMAVVGAHLDDDPDAGDNAGSAYLFQYTDGHWAPIVPKLTASDRAFDDEFGVSVGISGDTVIVGAHQNNARGPDSGSAYIFTEAPTLPGPMVGLNPSGADTTILSIRPDPFSVMPMVGGAGFRSLSGLDAHRGTGRLFASSGYAGGGGNGGKLFTIDSETGTATLIGPTGFAAVPGLAFDLDGTLFGSAATTDNGDTLITINPSSGAGTPVGPFGVPFLDSLALDPTTGILYGAGGEKPYELYTVDKTTGAATSLGVFAEIGSGDELPRFLAGLAFDHAGNLYGSLGAGDGRIISIDPSGSGPPTFAILGDAAGGSVSDIAFTFTVPEPSSFILLCMGAIYLLAPAWRWRRRPPT